MVKFSLDESGTKVKVTIDTGNGFQITTYYECGNKLYATLLMEQLRDNQYKIVEQFAKTNYEEGYNDKTKRKPKRDWHRSVLS